MEWLRKLPWQSVGRWWIVGLAFFVGGNALLYLGHGMLKLPLPAVTLVSSEITMLLRFFINDRWVFGHPVPSWARLWQYHLASAGGWVIWWIVANALPHFGIHYLIASTAGTACSVCFSMLTNFGWIWRRRVQQPPD